MGSFCQFLASSGPFGTPHYLYLNSELLGSHPRDFFVTVALKPSLKKRCSLVMNGYLKEVDKGGLRSKYES